jgi:hypothetical protein
MKSAQVNTMAMTLVTSTIWISRRRMGVAADIRAALRAG